MDNRSSGLGFTGVLTLIFIVLKLVGVVDWSWWLVLLPLLLNIGLVVVVLIVVFVCFIIERR